MANRTLLKDAAPKELPNLPLLAYTGHRAVRLGQGSTLVPQFKLLRFVPRPLCLAEDEALQPAQPQSDQWGATPPPRPGTAGNGATMQMAGHKVPLPTLAAVMAGGPLIDDEIPWG